MQNMLITNVVIVDGGIPAVINWKARYATKDCDTCNSLQSSMHSAFEGLKSDGLSDKQYKSLGLQLQTSSIDLGQHRAQEHPLEL